MKKPWESLGQVSQISLSEVVMLFLITQVSQFINEGCVIMDVHAINLLQTGMMIL